MTFFLKLVIGASRVQYDIEIVSLKMSNLARDALMTSLKKMLLSCWAS